MPLKKTSLMTLDYYRKSPKGKSVMGHLFDKLNVMYPGQWKSSFATPEEMRMWEETWAEAFERKQLSVESIKRGLNKCEDEFQKYPPSMPAFLQCCKGEVIPMAQRGFPLMLEQKLTTEQRKEGLKKLRVAKDSITIKTDDTGDGYE